MHPQLAQTSAEVESYAESYLFDANGIMYAGIDVLTNKPFDPEVFTPITIPRRADINPWAYWTYEDSMSTMGLYLDGLVRKYKVTGDPACQERAAKLVRVFINTYSCSQVYGIGSFLRPYGGYEGMKDFVEPLGTDQISSVFAALYLYLPYADEATKQEITEVMLGSLTWYEQQNFKYFYYKCFIHYWNQTYQHAASYYLPAIAWAANQTGDEKWKKHLYEKLALLQQEGYHVFGEGQGSFCWGSDLTILAKELGDEFHQFITPAMLAESFEKCKQGLAVFNEPGGIRRMFPESAEPGFQPYMRPGYDREQAMGFGYWFCVDGSRQRPRLEIHFLCALAALGYEEAFVQAEYWLALRRNVPTDFTDYVSEDHDKLPEASHLFARSVGILLLEWYRDYWMLRQIEAQNNREPYGRAPVK